MGINAHLRGLNAKHEKLDQQIKTELKKTMPDMLHITDLKKRKLQIKEQITHLRN